MGREPAFPLGILTYESLPESAGSIAPPSLSQVLRDGSLGFGVVSFEDSSPVALSTISLSKAFGSRGFFFRERSGILARYIEIRNRQQENNTN